MFNTGKADVMTIRTRERVVDIERKLNVLLPRIGVNEKEYLHNESTDLAMRVKGPIGMLGATVFCLEIFVKDYGAERVIDMVAVGSSMGEFFRTSFAREYGVYIEYGRSKKKRKELMRYF